MSWGSAQFGSRPGGRRVSPAACGGSRRGRRRTQCVAAVFLVACVGSPSAEQDDHSHESWTVTALGERFEVFPEIDALAVGHTATAHVHVTRLADFAPLTEGTVEIVLVDGEGEQVFRADGPVDPGHFRIELTPGRAGETDLLFRIDDGDGARKMPAAEADGLVGRDDGAHIEEIPGGRVRVGAADRPEGLVRAPELAAGSDGGEPVAFSKEQQWQGRFATAWVEEGRLARSVSGVATFRPPAGGESTITAQVDGVVQPPAGARSWPFVGGPRRAGRAPVPGRPPGRRRAESGDTRRRVRGAGRGTGGRAIARRPPP